MQYYVIHDEEIELGPFDSESKARDKAMMEATRRIKAGVKDGFGSSFRIAPEWRYVEDPEGWYAFHHIEQDESLFIEGTTDGFDVGVYEPDNGGNILEFTATEHRLCDAVCHLFSLASKVEQQEFEPKAKHQA